jgi:nucleoside-diphosphate-sugar epimerase
MQSLTLVTGASGFIGSRLCREIIRRDGRVRALVRSAVAPTPGVESHVVEDFSNADALRPALQGVTTVMHFAGRAHQVQDSASDPMAEFRRANVAATKALLTAAAGAGARRVVFASSVKAVTGSESDVTIDERTAAQPTDAYGISKQEAEDVVRAFDGRGGMRTSIIRLPLVYGPGVKANFLALFRAIDRGVPLPLGLVQNRRSIVFVGNVCDAAIAAGQHPAAAGETFFVGEGPPISSADLARAIGIALQRKAILLPIPVFAFRTLGLMGDVISPVVRSPVTTAAVRRLTGSLVTDWSRLRERLAWSPPFAMHEGLAETAEWYIATQRRG